MFARPGVVTTRPAIVYLSMAVLALMLVVLSVEAFAQYKVPDAGGGMFTNVIKFFNDIIAFLEGPFAKFALFCACVILAVAWAWTPQGAALGGLIRVVIAIAFIASLGTLFAALFK